MPRSRGVTTKRGEGRTGRHEAGYARLQGLEKKTDNKDEGGLDRLRILVADGHGHRVDEVQRTVTELGHEVVSAAQRIADSVAGQATGAEARFLCDGLCETGSTPFLEMVLA